MPVMTMDELLVWAILSDREEEIARLHRVREAERAAAERRTAARRRAVRWRMPNRFANDPSQKKAA